MTAPALPRRERPRPVDEHRTPADRRRDAELTLAAAAATTAGGDWQLWSPTGTSVRQDLGRYAAVAWWNRHVRSFEWDIYRVTLAVTFDKGPHDRLQLSTRTPNGLTETASEAIAAAHAALVDLVEGR